MSAHCTGFLINTTNAAQLPYLMTAAHCVSAYDVDNPPENRYYDWVFYFNYENMTCGGNGTNPIENANSITGAHVKTIGAANQLDNSGTNLTNSDFALLQLNNQPEQFYDVFYLGWNTSATVSTSVVSIHHPTGDAKKFSKDLSAPIESDADVGNGVNSYWEVDWDLGVTQPGSSGGPLLNSSGQVIGQLYGGISRCADSPPEQGEPFPTPAQSGPDWYGKLSHSISHANNGKSELSTFLDPTNTGITQMSGFDPPTPTGPWIMIKEIEQTTAFWTDINKASLVPLIAQSGDVGTLSYQWTPAEDFFNPNDPVGILYFNGSRPSLPFSKDYTLTVNGSNGYSSSLSIQVSLYDCEDKTIYLDVCSDRSTTLGYPTNPAETYSWSPSTNLDNSTVSNPTFTPPGAGIYNITATIIQDICTRTEQYEIVVEDLPPVPNFTPSKIGDKTIGTSVDNRFSAAAKVSDGYIIAAKGRSVFGNDFWKVDESMNIVWSKDHFPVSYSTNNIYETADGGIFLGGIDAYGNANLFVWKLDSYGNHEWAKFYSHAGSTHTRGGYIQPTNDGNYVIAGHRDTNTGNKSFLKKISSSNGNIIWSREYASVNNIRCMSQANDGGFVLGGWPHLLKVSSSGISETSRNDLGSIVSIKHTEDGGYFVGTDLFVFDGSKWHSDFKVYRLDADLSTLWEKQVGGSAWDELRDMIITPDNGIILAGRSDSPASGDKSQNARNNTHDYWIIKLDQYGNVAGDRRYGGDARDELHQIIRHENGQYYLAGVSESGVSGDKTTASLGGVDIWFAKIKDDDEPLPDPNPGTNYLCEDFNGTFNNTNNPIRDEVVIIGDCPDELVVHSGATVSIRASDYILIKPDTHIANGSSFQAKIGAINLHACDLEASGVISRSYQEYRDTTTITTHNLETIVEDIDFEEKYLTHRVSVFPNPVDDILTISLSKPGKEANFVILDILGKEIKSGYINGNFHKINLSDLTSGIYHLIVSSRNNKIIFSNKIIVQHD